MRLVIFGGTTEGREFSHLLAQRVRAEILVCVATEYGREEQGEAPGVTVLCGGKTRDEMAELLKTCDLCVDATHPYAVEATENIRAACELTGTPYRRLLRQAGGSADGGLLVDSAEEAASLLAQREGNILLTTGAKELPAFRELDPERLFPRILPSHKGLDACEAVNIPHRNILALQGPFTQEMNEAMIRQYHIAFVVTKDGGKAGGFREKVQAAEAAGAEMVIIRRPEETGETFEELLKSCEEMLR